VDKSEGAAGIPLARRLGLRGFPWPAGWGCGLGRHVLLIADIRVAAGSDLAGRPVEDVHQTGQVRVIARQRPGADRVDWSPGHRRLLAPQDRIYVLATREGLSLVLARSQPARA
jgi:hypothetical protein